MCRLHGKDRASRLVAYFIGLVQRCGCPVTLTLSCSIGKALYLASDLPASRPVRPQAGSYVGCTR
jgi:hypothetical protein